MCVCVKLEIRRKEEIDVCAVRTLTGCDVKCSFFFANI